MDSLPKLLSSKVPEGKAIGALESARVSYPVNSVLMLLLLTSYLNFNKLLHLFMSQFSYLSRVCPCKLTLAGFLQSLALFYFHFINHHYAPLHTVPL